MPTLKDYLADKYADWTIEELCQEFNESYKLGKQATGDLMMAYGTKAGSALNEIKDRFTRTEWRAFLRNNRVTQVKRLLQLMQLAKEMGDCDDGDEEPIHQWPSS